MWLSQSKAFERPQKIAHTLDLSWRGLKITWIKIWIAFFVFDFAQNQICSSTKIVSLFICSSSLICLTSSQALENEVSRDISLQLEMLFLLSFLNNGFITENFKWSGRIPDDSDLLHVWFKGEPIKGELIFSNLVEFSNHIQMKFLILRIQSFSQFV